jgi:hypothetical protein
MFRPFMWSHSAEDTEQFCVQTMRLLIFVTPVARCIRVRDCEAEVHENILNSQLFYLDARN